MLDIVFRTVIGFLVLLAFSAAIASVVGGMILLGRVFHMDPAWFGLGGLFLAFCGLVGSLVVNP